MRRERPDPGRAVRRRRGPSTPVFRTSRGSREPAPSPIDGCAALSGAPGHRTAHRSDHREGFGRSARGSTRFSSRGRGGSRTGRSTLPRAGPRCRTTGTVSQTPGAGRRARLHGHRVQRGERRPTGCGSMPPAARGVTSVTPGLWTPPSGGTAHHRPGGTNLGCALEVSRSVRRAAPSTFRPGTGAVDCRGDRVPLMATSPHGAPRTPLGAGVSSGRSSYFIQPRPRARDDGRTVPVTLFARDLTAGEDIGRGLDF